MPGKSLAQKLFIRENYVVLVLNAPKDVVASLGPLPKGVQIVAKASKPVDFILAFASKKMEMSKLVLKAKPLLKQDALLWLAYPKAGQLDTDLKREVVWECGQEVGMHPVTQIAIDEVWSALRFKDD